MNDFVIGCFIKDPYKDDKHISDLVGDDVFLNTHDCDYIYSNCCDLQKEFSATTKIKPKLIKKMKNRFKKEHKDHIKLIEDRIGKPVKIYFGVIDTF